MEHSLVLASGVAAGFALAGSLVWASPKAPLPPITAKAKTGFCYLGLVLIAIGLVNLFYGFVYGEMFVSGRYGGYVGWMRYGQHKRAFALFGFIYSFMIWMGIGLIRLNVFLTETEKPDRG